MSILATTVIDTSATSQTRRRRPAARRRASRDPHSATPRALDCLDVFRSTASSRCPSPAPASSSRAAVASSRDHAPSASRTWEILSGFSRARCSCAPWSMMRAQSGRAVVANSRGSLTVEVPPARRPRAVVRRTPVPTETMISPHVRKLQLSRAHSARRAVRGATAGLRRDGARVDGLSHEAAIACARSTAASRRRGQSARSGRNVGSEFRACRRDVPPATAPRAGRAFRLSYFFHAAIPPTRACRCVRAVRGDARGSGCERPLASVGRAERDALARRDRARLPPARGNRRRSRPAYRSRSARRRACRSAALARKAVVDSPRACGARVLLIRLIGARRARPSARAARKQLAPAVASFSKRRGAPRPALARLVRPRARPAELRRWWPIPRRWRPGARLTGFARFASLRGAADLESSPTCGPRAVARGRCCSVRDSASSGCRDLTPQTLAACSISVPRWHRARLARGQAQRGPSRPREGRGDSCRDAAAGIAGPCCFRRTLASEAGRSRCCSISSSWHRGAVPCVVLPRSAGPRVGGCVRPSSRPAIVGWSSGCRASSGGVVAVACVRLGLDTTGPPDRRLSPARATFLKAAARDHEPGARRATAASRSTAPSGDPLAVGASRTARA